MSAQGEFVVSNGHGSGNGNGHGNSNGSVPHNSYTAALSPQADDAPIVEEHTSATGTPVKFVPLSHLYNATSEGSSGNGNSNGSNKGGSRKGKSRRLDRSQTTRGNEALLARPSVRMTYARRSRNVRMAAAAFGPALSLYERLLKRAKLPPTDGACHEDGTVGVAERDGEKIQQQLLDNGAISSASDESVGEEGFSHANGQSMKDSVDNSAVHSKGTEGAAAPGNVESVSIDSSAPGFNSVFTPDTEDRDGIKQPEENHPGESANGVVVPPSAVDGGGQAIKKHQKKRKFEGVELLTDKRIRGCDFGRGPRLRDSRARQLRAAKLASGRNSQTVRPMQTLHTSARRLESLAKRWIEVSFAGVEPLKLVNLECKVYWPMDEDWYAGRIVKFDPETNEHHVEYDDGEKEQLLLTEEKVKLRLTREEMSNLNLKDKEQEIIDKMKKLDYDEMAALAVELDGYQEELGHGDLIWAKITGHPMWPAFVMDEAHANACNGLESAPREGSIPVQFFGSYDYARISSKQIVLFSRGLEGDYHLKCKRLLFLRGLEEADSYLKEQKLPEEMAKLQNVVKSGCQTENEEEREVSDAGVDCMGDERSEKIKKSVKCLFNLPIAIGGLRVETLGKIVKDSEHFHTEHHIWTQGYTAKRKFSSIKDPSKSFDYKMEVLRDPINRNVPLFRVTLEDKEQIDGSTPNACWRKIYPRLDKAKQKLDDDLNMHMEKKRQYRSGSYMFGFSNRRIAELIQALPHARACTKFTDWIDKSAVAKCEEVLPAGYRPVQVQWKDLDRCSVCHMEEEYVNNLFLQCDKCRMMVHANCYGEREPLDGRLWLCNLCRPGAPKKCPPCCLCPITGGAMKKTTDGRWAHLTCATWIPETCLVDIKRMEPIDGINTISKDRWKLICSICEVPYGACIQCSNHSCRVAYHPLCARAAGLCVEVQEEKNARHIGIDDESEQHLRLLSFCKKHRQPADEQTPIDQQRSIAHRDCSSYTPPSNPSGCARCEPYNFSARRGRKEPEALVAASIKRLFVENRPHLVSGYCRKGTWAKRQFNDETSLESNRVRDQHLHELESTRLSSSEPQSEGHQQYMSDKYAHMRATFRKRLAFGKSGIHGFGIFAKQAHKGGDMIIEYTGEIVRPTIADIREHFIYNSLVGAGTYMFRIDEERVIDATRAGSIAHLINHSCEPNCYSRVITVDTDEHIIIFAKRDIKQWEELTYDYRFFSIDEQLACYCGFPRCRGIVNVNDTEDQVGKICVPCSELIDWRPDNVQ